MRLSPFAPADGKKTCGRCGRELPEDDEHFYRYPSGTFRAYCKTCMKIDSTRNRRERRQGVKPVQAVCDCCQIRSNTIFYDDEGRPFCYICWVYVSDEDMDMPSCMVALKHLRDHEIAVEERRERHHSNRPFNPHEKYFWWTKDEQMFIPPDHRECPRMVEKLRAVLRWKAARAGSGAPS